MEWQKNGKKSYFYPVAAPEKVEELMKEREDRVKSSLS